MAVKPEKAPLRSAKGRALSRSNERAVAGQCCNPHKAVDWNGSHRDLLIQKSRGAWRQSGLKIVPLVVILLRDGVSVRAEKQKSAPISRRDGCQKGRSSSVFRDLRRRCSLRARQGCCHCPRCRRADRGKPEDEISERWQSGRLCSTGNAVSPKGDRGFESRPLRCLKHRSLTDHGSCRRGTESVPLASARRIGTRPMET